MSAADPVGVPLRISKERDLRPFAMSAAKLLGERSRDRSQPSDKRPPPNSEKTAGCSYSARGGHRVRPAQALDWPLKACFAVCLSSADIDPGQQLIIVIGKGTLIAWVRRRGL